MFHYILLRQFGNDIEMFRLIFVCSSFVFFRHFSHFHFCYLANGATFLPSSFLAPLPSPAIDSVMTHEATFAAHFDAFKRQICSFDQNNEEQRRCRCEMCHFVVSRSHLRLVRTANVETADSQSEFFFADRLIFVRNVKKERKEKGEKRLTTRCDKRKAKRTIRVMQLVR